MHYALFNYDISKANHYDGARSYTRINIAQTTYSNDDMEQGWQKFQKNFKAETAKPFMYDIDYRKRLQAYKRYIPKYRTSGLYRSNACETASDNFA